MSLLPSWSDQAISPLDGRYGPAVGHLGRYFSEPALMQARCLIECAFVRALDALNLFRPLSEAEKRRLHAVPQEFSERDYQRIKECEQQTRHDVKACEIFLRERLELQEPEMIHFGLTSEDINNLAYALLLQEFHQDCYLKQLSELMDALAHFAESEAATVFPARTHGQMASPTTAGKEAAVFLGRLLPLLKKLKQWRFSGKLNGATGNWSALVAVFPEVDWIAFSRTFITDLGLQPNCITTQIEPHDSLAEYFDTVRHVNNVVLDLNVDMWLYISYGLLRQRKESATQVGSSTMPHKINPIRFENSEGNLDVSNGLLVSLSNKLTRSRMQRDLSDSTCQRNMGVALAHAWLGMKETYAGLQLVSVDREEALGQVAAHPEVLAEAVQTFLRRSGLEDPYEILRKFTQGHSLSLESLSVFIDGLPSEQEQKERMKKWRPENYLGLAQGIALEAVRNFRAVR